MPGSIQRSKKILSTLLVAHITMSAPAIASSGCATGMTSTPSTSLICRAKASRLSALGLKQRMVSMSRTAQTAMSCAPACQPEPRMATVLASLRARYLTPSPLAAPTRMRCMTPSGKIASGSPVSVENKQHQPDIAVARRRRHFFAADIVAALRPGDDVGIDADRADAELRNDAVHGFQAVQRVLARGRRETVGARARHAAAFGELDIGLFEHVDAFRHGQQLVDIVVGQDQGHLRCTLVMAKSYRAHHNGNGPNR